MCYWCVVDQMHYGIPLFHWNSIIFHHSQRDPPELTVSLSLCHCKLEYGHLRQHIKVKAQ